MLRLLRWLSEHTGDKDINIYFYSLSGDMAYHCGLLPFLLLGQNLGRGKHLNAAIVPLATAQCRGGAKLRGTTVAPWLGVLRTQVTPRLRLLAFLCKPGGGGMVFPCPPSLPELVSLPKQWEGHPNSPR